MPDFDRRGHLHHYWAALRTEQDRRAFSYRPWPTQAMSDAQLRHAAEISLGRLGSWKVEAEMPHGRYLVAEIREIDSDGERFFEVLGGGHVQIRDTAPSLDDALDLAAALARFAHDVEVERSHGPAIRR
jgi:hypothetical protein